MDETPLILCHQFIEAPLLDSLPSTAECTVGPPLMDILYSGHLITAECTQNIHPPFMSRKNLFKGPHKTCKTTVFVSMTMWLLVPLSCEASK